MPPTPLLLPASYRLPEIVTEPLVTETLFVADMPLVKVTCGCKGLIDDIIGQADNTNSARIDIDL